MLLYQGNNKRQRTKRRAAGVSRRLATVAMTTNGINRVLMHAVVLPLAPVLAAALRGRKPTESTAIMRRFLIVSGSLRSRLAKCRLTVRGWPFGVSRRFFSLWRAPGFSRVRV